MSILARDRIYFLLKDPHWSFIWWQVNSVHGVNVIRVHDVTDIIFDGHNSHGYVELNDIGAADHWYFQLPLAGRNYCAEIGVKTRTQFSVIARSNTLFVPRASPNPVRPD